MNRRPISCARLLVAAGLLWTGAARTSTNTDLETLRAEVTKLAAPYLVTGANLRVGISQSMFSKVTTAISSLPAEKRRATFDGQTASGYVWNQGGGFAGCGAFAEINSGGKDFHFTVDIGGLSAVWQPDGRMAVHLNAAANAWGTIHGHVRGPAGMCSGPSLTYPVGRWSCDCAIGGGAGTVVGIKADKGSDFDGYLTLNVQPDGQIAYALVLTSPQSLSVTVSAELEHIGNIGFPMSFSLPSSPLLQGQIVGVMKSQGVLKIAGTEKPYALSLSNLRVRPDAHGLELLGDAALSAAGQ